MSSEEDHHFNLLNGDITSKPRLLRVFNQWGCYTFVMDIVTDGWHEYNRGDYARVFLGSTPEIAYNAWAAHREKETV